VRRGWPALRWRITSEPQPHEARLLYLDSAQARSRLNWQPVWTFDQAIAATTDWYRAWLERGSVLSREQLRAFTGAMREPSPPGLRVKIARTDLPA